MKHLKYMKENQDDKIPSGLVPMAPGGDYVLLKWDSNWADEMDVEGFKIVSKSQFEEWSERMKERRGFNICIGTNEDIEYSNGRELLSEIKVKPISEDEANVIKKFFGTSGGYSQFYTGGGVFGERR